MNIRDEIPCLIVEDYYTPSELEDIKIEILFLEPKLGDESSTNAATDSSGYVERKKKSGRGLFLDGVYTDRKYSSILQVSRKLFRDPVIRSQINLFQTDTRDKLYWNLWNSINTDTTILQCYRNGDYYKYHEDTTLFTSITTLKFKNQQIGGDLMFKSPKDGSDLLYQAPHNSMILFPSVLSHSVTEVQASPPNDIFDMRWSISHLISIKV